MMESGEIICEKVYASPRPPPKISIKDKWMKELDSEVAGGGKDSQRIQSRSTTQLSRTEKPASGQPTGLFTQLAETNIEFRVSGLPHAIVKSSSSSTASRSATK